MEQRKLPNLFKRVQANAFKPAVAEDDDDNIEASHQQALAARCASGDTGSAAKPAPAAAKSNSAPPSASNSAAMPVDMVTSSGRDPCPESDGAPTSAAKPGTNGRSSLQAIAEPEISSLLDLQSRLECKASDPHVQDFLGNLRS